jgi:hypothetical protein
VSCAFATFSNWLALAILWAFALQDWPLVSQFAVWHQSGGTVERRQYLATAAGVAPTAQILPVWVLVRVVGECDRAEHT